MLNPSTPFAGVAPFLELCDVIVVMSVEPGYGGQTFIHEVLPKIEQAREWVEDRGLPTDIEVDGGITPETARLAAMRVLQCSWPARRYLGPQIPPSAVAELRRAMRKE